MLMESCGESGSALASVLSPPSWYDETRQSASLIFRNSKPALRSVSDASGRCFPVAHASIRFGEALLVGIENEKSWSTALPPPPPLPVEPLPALATPHENDASSISPGCVLSVLSPSITI